MDRLIVVTLNLKEDTLGPAPFTPVPRVTPWEIPVPKAPNKQSVVTDDPILALNDDTADFAINCIGGTIKAHKSILAARSPYFARMFRFGGQLKEACTQEATLPDVSRRIMQYALDFIYKRKYIVPGGELIPTDFCNHEHALCSPDAPLRARIFKKKCKSAGQTLAPHHLLPHIHVYALSDYLDMEDLKRFARRGVLMVLHVYWKDKRMRWKNALDAAFFQGTDEKDRGLRVPFIGTILQDHVSLWADDGPISRWLEEHRDTWIKLAID